MYANPLSDTSVFVDELVALYLRKGDVGYGSECVTQLEHALQCAALAQADGATDELVAAALLHDLGHLMHDLGPAAERTVDDRHEYRPLHRLRRHYGEAVLAPIRMHVEAKRYLCASKPGYHDSLSRGSQVSLQLQGGAFTPLEARAFMRQPHAWDAVRLRVWDDRAKMPGKATPPLDAFAEVLLRCAL